MKYQVLGARVFATASSKGLDRHLASARRRRGNRPYPQGSCSQIVGLFRGSFALPDPAANRTPAQRWFNWIAEARPDLTSTASCRLPAPPPKALRAWRTATSKARLSYRSRRHPAQREPSRERISEAARRDLDRPHGVVFSRTRSDLYCSTIARSALPSLFTSAICKLAVALAPLMRCGGTDSERVPRLETTYRSPY